MPSENYSTNLAENPESKALAEVVAQAFSVFQTPPALTISGWADSERQLSREASAEPGQWDTTRAEYLRGIMDAVSDPAVEMVVVMSAAQCGKTEAVLNTIGYHIHHDPCPMLVVMPNDQMCTSLSRDRIAPMVRDSPALKGLIKEPKSRTTGNTVNHKLFPGGHLTLASAQSTSNLSARPCRVICFDEVDRFIASTSEGDPVTLGRQRSVSFWNRKILMTSTPTVRGESRIEAAYETSDQRRFWIPCESCETFQDLDWQSVIWDEKKPETARYRCGHCEAEWTDQQRLRSIQKGEWRASGDSKGVAGFHLSGLYSPFISLGQAATEFVQSK